MPHTLLYMTYGGDPYHQETMFSILSARRFAAAGEGPRVLVYTDRPADYGWLDVDVRALTPAMMETWIGGPGGYPFRRKVACILDALGTGAGKLAFLDGDTYFRRHPNLLFHRIGSGRACLHLREQRLTRRAGTAGLALGRLFDSAVVLDPAGQPVRLRPREAMWNSGVIGVDESDAAKVAEALRLIDDIWAHEQSIRTLEQFALGHVLGRCDRDDGGARGGTLSPTEDIVFHYWHARQRAPFLARLPHIIAQARRIPLAQAAAWAYPQRPVEVPLRRIAGVLRNALHAAGGDHRWTRTSF